MPAQTNAVEMNTCHRLYWIAKDRLDLSDLLAQSVLLLNARNDYFLNRFANAWRAFVGGPEEVSRSTTVRGAKSSQILREFLFTIRAVIGLLHSKRALGSKYAH